MQGDSADSMLTWVLGQRGQEAMKDPDLAKQVTLAVLRQTIPNPKVLPFDLTLHRPGCIWLALKSCPSYAQSR